MVWALVALPPFPYYCQGVIVSPDFLYSCLPVVGALVALPPIPCYFWDVVSPTCCSLVLLLGMGCWLSFPPITLFVHFLLGWGKTLVLNPPSLILDYC